MTPVNAARRRTFALSGACLVLAASLLSIAHPTFAATTFVVNRTTDAGDNNLADSKCDTSANAGSQCTLRAAIQEANDTSGRDTITFNIQSSATTKVIAPNSALPAIVGAVTINGYSQPGASANTSASGNNAVLKIVLDGLNAGGGAVGLDVLASNSIIRGLVIQRFDEAGIRVSGSGNLVRGNFIGTNAAGTLARGNTTGVILQGPDNIVGGTTAATRNLISGNISFGIKIEHLEATGNQVQGNFIGTTKNGTAALGNGDAGVLVFEASGNTIGGTASGARNIVSGNHDAGILVQDAAGVDNGSLVLGNFVGTDRTGTAAIPNALGGIHVLADGVRVGGTDPGDRNVVSGNLRDGLAISGSNNVVQGNFVGTDATGNAALGNAGAGVEFESHLGRVGTANQIGGTTPGAGNVISANGLSGITVRHVAVLVQGNRIGSKADGSGDLGNRTNGITLFEVRGNVIGGSGSAGNLITGNAEDGIFIFGSTNTTIQGNAIVANDRDGIDVHDGSHTIAGNFFIQNGRAGVTVTDRASGVRISANHMNGNGRLGIDLVGGFSNTAGVTANDTDDPDPGPNGLQNHPVLTSAIRSNATGVTTIAGTLNSTPNTEFRIELFVAAADPSGFGEGQIFQIATNITTNSEGDSGFSIALATVAAGQALTASATATGAGNTSEFSANISVVRGP